MIKSRTFLLFIFCFTFILSTHAQDKGNTILLKEILNTISKKHKVTFNYLEDEIAIFKIVPPPTQFKLKYKLEYISQITRLKFNYISKNYISIVNDKKLDKPLCGILQDEFTKEPIAFASIHIKDTKIFVISNESGYFQLPIKSSNDIVINHINYSSINVVPLDLYKENCPTLFLKPIVTELTEVVAQVFITKGIARKQDGTIELNPKKFGLLPGMTEPDVFQTMNQLPGITNVDETVSNISVRGGTHDQNLFLWNGIRLFQTSHFFGLISALNPNLANIIKISKNGSSPFYGESVSSVVDISSHTNAIENGGTSVGLNMINADFYTKVKTSKKSDLEISSRRSITDLVSTPTYKNYSDKVFQNTVVTNLSNITNVNFTNDEKFYFYDITAQYHHKINEKQEFFIDAINISNRLDVAQTKAQNNTTLGRNSFLKQETLAGSFLYKIKWNANTKTEINSYFSNYTVDSENESIENNQIFNQLNTIHDIAIRIQNNHKISDKLFFNNGYQFNEIGVRNNDAVNNPQLIRNLKTVLKTHAIIGALSFESENRKINSTIGVRANYIEDFKKFIIEPRLQFNYAFNTTFQIEVLGEQKNQTSLQVIDLQQDFLGIEKRRWVLSNNDNIPILQSSQLSIGFILKKNNWLISVDNFYKKVSGIYSRSQGFQNQLEFLRINGSYVALGAEFLIQKQIKNFTASLNYTTEENDYNFNNYSPSHFSNSFEISQSLSFAAIYTKNNFKIALGSKWFTGKPITLPASNTPIYTTPGIPEVNYLSPNSDKLKNYFQINFSSDYTFKMENKSQFQLGLSIQNVLNTKNIINQYYQINNTTNSINQINTYSLTLTPNVFLRYKI